MVGKELNDWSQDDAQTESELPGEVEMHSHLRHRRAIPPTRREGKGIATFIKSLADLDH